MHIIASWIGLQRVQPMDCDA